MWFKTSTYKPNTIVACSVINCTGDGKLLKATGRSLSGSTGCKATFGVVASTSTICLSNTIFIPHTPRTLDIRMHYIQLVWNTNLYSQYQSFHYPNAGIR